jgi:uncharacterized protein YhaN
MKITQVHLAAFGPFTDTVIDLNHGNQGLHIIYGPNEAGKSSALRALRNAFYGIPVRSPDNFRHPHTQMRIKMSIRGSDGKTFTFVRRKGAKNTLRAADDKKPLDESILHRFLNHVDESIFSTMFGIGHADLVRGGREIIKGGGNLGQIIFSAGAGISGLRNLQTGLLENADALFKPSGKNPAINQLIARVRENRKNLKEIELATADWENHDTALRAALEKKKITERCLADAMAEKNRLERIFQSLPMIARRKKLTEDLKGYASVTLLPQNFGELRREAISKLKIAENDHAHAAAAIRQLGADIRGLEVSHAVLNSAEEIERMYQELGGFKKAARDRIQLQNRMEILRSEAAQILNDLRDDMTLEDAEKLRLTKKDTLAVASLGSRYERIIALIESTREQIPQLSHQIKEIEARLAGLPACRDTSQLQMVMETSADYASMEIQCLEETAECSRSIKSIEAELSRQSFWSGPLDALTQLALPGFETIDRFENEFDTLATLIRKNRDELTQLEKEFSDTENKIQELNFAFSVPTENDLVKARNHRSAIWKIISEIIASPDAREDIIARFFKNYPEEKNLCAGFENAVAVADEIGDRLRREADRVATLAKLVSDKSTIEKRINHLTGEKTTCETDLNAVSEKWQALWSPAGITPASPKEMRAWLHRINDITARFGDITQRLTRANEKLAKIEKIRDSLHAALAALNAPVADREKSLKEILKTAGKIVETENGRSEAREHLLAEKSRLTAQLSEYKIRSQTNETDLEAWQNQWERAVSPLGLDRDAAPAHANAFLEDLKQLFDKLKEADILKKRITGIDRDADDFKTRVQTLMETAGPAFQSLSGLSPDQAAAEMMRLLKETRTALSEKQALERQLEKENHRQKQSAKAMEDAAAVLRTLCEEAGCSHYQDLADAENRSAIRREIESGIQAAESRLLEMSAGMDLEKFVAACQSESADALPAKIESLAEQIDVLSKDKSAVDQAIGSERTILDRMDGSSRAAQLAEDTQIILGGLEDHAETYARYKIAAAVLSRAIEAFSEKNQSPMLQKASRFFSRITDGSFESIRAEFDDAGTPVIAGIRDKGREIVTVDGMSEGTGDQLYLSLRLAGLDDYLENNEPMPFIIDDILVQFDDNRARAALETLAELSAKTQIIFFTHHRHLLDLAEKHIDSSELFRHNL